MKIKTLFKTIFCAGLVLTLVLYLCHLYGNYIEKTQKSVADYRAGKTNALGFLVGQCMKASKGKANPQMVNELLTQKLG